MENIKRKQEAILSKFLAELAKLKENETALIEFDLLDHQRAGARLVVNDARRHHAFDDPKANRSGWLALETSQK